MNIVITFEGVAIAVRIIMSGLFVGSAILCHRSADPRTAALWWIAAGAWLP